jgi:hypothetical protein
VPLPLIVRTVTSLVPWIRAPARTRPRLPPSTNTRGSSPELASQRPSRLNLTEWTSSGWSDIVCKSAPSATRQIRSVFPTFFASRDPKIVLIASPNVVCSRLPLATNRPSGEKPIA